MTKSPPLALVLTGQVRRYPLLRLSSLADHLGPVKGVSYRQASRIANTLRAGFPVKGYAELARSRVIVICAPERQLPGLLGELAEAIDWRRKTALLGGGPYDSGHLAELAARGAEVGSVHALEDNPPVRFLIEGDRRAVRWARRLVEQAGGVPVEIEPGTAGACAAGGSFASWLLVTLLDASASCFRRAGLRPGQAGPVAAHIAQRAVRRYLRAGRRACRMPETIDERTRFRLQLESLRRTDPALAAFLLEAAVLAAHYLRQDAAWLSELGLHRAAGRG